MRVALAAERVPTQPWPSCNESRPIAEEATVAAASPPVRDCSENDSSGEATRAKLEPASARSGEATETDRSLDEIKPEARRDFLRPAQAESAEAITLPERGAGREVSLAGLTRRERRKKMGQPRRRAKT